MEDKEVITSTVILEEVSALGKLELVKYQFKEVVEYEKIKPYIVPLGSDSRAVLIAKGEAVGCIDLRLLLEEDIYVTADTLFLALPPPELCYFKLDLQNTRLYDLKTGYFDNREKFIEETYRYAEGEIRKIALASGILTETKKNAQTFLVPTLELMTGKKVVITHKPQELIMEERLD